jgi:hypothetical protein
MKKQHIPWFGFFVILFLVITSIEFLAFLTTSLLIQENFIFCPLLINESYQNYQQRYLPTQGWMPPYYPTNDFYDLSGSRRIPAFPDPERTPPRISLYGDSFTEAWGVKHEHAWSNILSLLLNCRVSNFGVAGYGTDQAYLRFLHNIQDPAEIVILCIFPENIKRNVNQFRNLISTVTSCQTKPRFILNNEGHLRLVPIPPLSESEYHQITQNPGRFFRDEFFLPDGPSGRQIAKFPYFWGMAKASIFLLKNLGRVDKYEFFYQVGHPSQGLEVTTAIIKEFCHTSHKRGKRPVIFIIPTDYDILTYQQRQTWNYQLLLDRLAESQLEYMDAGPQIIQYLNGANRRTLYSPDLAYHFNEEGNRLLASILKNFLTTRSILDVNNSVPSTSHRINCSITGRKLADSAGTIHVKPTL